MEILRPIQEHVFIFGFRPPRLGEGAITGTGGKEGGRKEERKGSEWESWQILF
jgi:hypothetical protein